jgi:hypothetical protein
MTRWYPAAVPGLLSPSRAFVLGAIGVLLQILVLLPPVEHAIEESQPLHYLQHGLIFVGGVFVGIALRDLWLMQRRAAG